jgi:hypothetical protein
MGDEMMNKIKSTGWLLQSIILVSLAMPVSAAQVEDVVFPERYTASDVDLKIRGTGLLRYMIFIKAYVGGLYLPEDVSSDKALSEVPKRLEVEYFHAIKGEDFGAATRSMIAKNVDEATFRRLEPKIALHNSMYEDVKPGDRYSLTYIPGKGTELALNGEPKGTVEGSEFAAALFSIWLGNKPIDDSFKKQILGLK